MVSIVPGILENSWGGVFEKLALLAGLTDWVHIDVSDGRFAPNKTWGRPKDLLGAGDVPNIEAHLMVENVSTFLPSWLDSLVGRIIFHQEAVGKDGKALVDKIKAAGKEAVLAFNLDTPWQGAQEVLPFVDGVLLLSVKPGWSGQAMDLGILNKISSLRSAFPNLVIEVDGGVKPSFIKDLMAAGATRFVSTSYIYKGKSPRAAIGEYKKEILSYS